MATHATIPVDHDTKARFIRYVAAQQARTGRRVTHSAAINALLDLDVTLLSPDEYDHFVVSE